MVIPTRHFFIYRSATALRVPSTVMRWGELEDHVHALILDAQDDLELAGINVEQELPDDQWRELEDVLAGSAAEGSIDESEYAVLLSGEAVVGFSFSDSNGREYAVAFRPVPELSAHLIGRPAANTPTLPLLKRRQ